MCRQHSSERFSKLRARSAGRPRASRNRERLSSGWTASRTWRRKAARVSSGQARFLRASSTSASRSRSSTGVSRTPLFKAGKRPKDAVNREPRRAVEFRAEYTYASTAMARTVADDTFPGGTHSAADHETGRERVRCGPATGVRKAPDCFQ